MDEAEAEAEQQEYDDPAINGLASDEDDYEERPRKQARGRGNPKQRMLAAFNQDPHAVFEQFGIKLPADLDDASLKLANARIDELKQEMQTRPDGTINTYWPLQELYMEAIRGMQAAGVLPSSYQSDNAPGGLRVEQFAEVYGDSVLPILKKLAEGHKKDALIKEVVQSLTSTTGDSSLSAEQDAEAVAAAAREAEDAARELNQDDYADGETVYIVGSAAPDAVEDLSHQLVLLAVGRIMAESDVDAGGFATYRVGELQKIDEEAEQQGIWVDDPSRGHDITNTTLGDIIAAGDSLLVPVSQLKRVQQRPDAPQQRLNPEASGAPEQTEVTVTASKVKQMKVLELQKLCRQLNLHLHKDVRRKKPYQDMLMQWIGEETVDGKPGRTATITVEHVPPRAAGAGSQQPAVQISKFLFKNALNALTDLQQIQRLLLGDGRAFANIREHPRVKRFIHTFRRLEGMANRRCTKDRQSGTMATLPTARQITIMLAGHWGKHSGEGLKARAMWLWQSAVAGRGENVRKHEYGDCFVTEYADLQPVKGKAVVRIMGNGKTNQNGQLQYQAALNHRDPLQCPIAADGAWQMWRYGIDGGLFPDLTKSADEWICTPVFPSSTGDKMGYEEHRSQVRGALDAAESVGGKSTHLPRLCVRNIIYRGGTRDMAMSHALWLRQEADLSYLNLPDINALVKMADFRDLERHYQTWTAMQPPEKCVRLAFKTPDGTDILQQTDKILELNKKETTRSITALGVARYFECIAVSFLQALPLMLDDSRYAGHPVLQHPAINNPEYRAYAIQQRKCAREQQQLYQLSQTPQLGPVITTALGSGRVASTAMYSSTEMQRRMTAASTAYGNANMAAGATAAGLGIVPHTVTYSVGDGMHFMLVTTDEMQQLLCARARAGQSSGASPDTAAAAAAAAAEAPEATASSAATAAAGATASDAAAAGPTASGTEAAAAAAQFNGGAHVDLESTPSTSDDDRPPSDRPASNSGDIESGQDIPAAAAADAADASRAAGSGVDASAASTGSAAAAAAAASSSRAAAAPAAPSAPNPGSSGGTDKDTSKYDTKVLIGMTLQLLQLAQQGNVRFGTNPAAVPGAQVRPATVSTGQTPAQAAAAAATAAADHAGIQQQHAAAAHQAAASELSDNIGDVNALPLKSSSFQTVPRLVQCWYEGWPLDVPPESKVYKPLPTGGFTLTGLDKGAKVQVENWNQVILLIKAVSRDNQLSQRLATEVVELWRQQKAAVIVLGADGQPVSVCDASNQQQAPATVRQLLVPPQLASQAGKPLSIHKLCNQCRAIPEVAAQKNQNKSGAGRLGGSVQGRKRKVKSRLSALE